MLSSAIPLGSEFRVNTYTTADQWKPAIAADAEGNFVVAWNSAEQSALNAVYARRYDAFGSPFDAEEFRANNAEANNHSAPGLAVSPDGDFVITWCGELGSGVFARRFNAAGVPQGQEIFVNGYEAEQAVAAIDADGNFVIVSVCLDAESFDVFARRFNAVGEPLGQELRVNTYTTGLQFDASVAMAARGEFVVAWGSVQSGSGYDVHARRFDGTGAPVGDQFRVNTSTANEQFAPSVAMAADGAFVVAWASGAFFSDNWEVYAQRHDAAGVPQGNEFLVNSYTTGVQSFPSVATDADGEFVIAWESSGQDGSLEGIYAQRFGAAGEVQGAEFQVSTYTTDRQRLSAVAMDADGDFIIGWHSWMQDGSGYGVYAQRYGVVPAVTSSSFHFESAPHHLRFDFDRDVRDSLTTKDLIVQNLTTGQTIPPDQFRLKYDDDSDVAEFAYSGQDADAIGGVLSDGQYRATLIAEGVVTPAGAPLAEDLEFEFFFLNGDATRDGLVNLDDFSVLAQHFGQTNTTFGQADFTYDGTTNLDDFQILAARFGAGLAPSVGAHPFAHGDPEDENDPRDLLRC